MDQGRMNLYNNLIQNNVKDCKDSTGCIRAHILRKNCHPYVALKFIGMTGMWH